MIILFKTDGLILKKKAYLQSSSIPPLVNRAASQYISLLTVPSIIDHCLQGCLNFEVLRQRHFGRPSSPLDPSSYDRLREGAGTRLNSNNSTGSRLQPLRGDPDNLLPEGTNAPQRLGLPDRPGRRTIVPLSFSTATKTMHSPWVHLWSSGTAPIEHESPGVPDLQQLRRPHPGLPPPHWSGR